MLKIPPVDVKAPVELIEKLPSTLRVGSFEAAVTVTLLDPLPIAKALVTLIV